MDKTMSQLEFDNDNKEDKVKAICINDFYTRDIKGHLPGFNYFVS